MTTPLLYLLGVLVFAGGLALSIALHEGGHMVPAKLFGVKVTQFFVGFGRTVWSRRMGETEYGLKSLPLGGYVKLVGMLPPAKDGDPTEVRETSTGMFRQLVSDARTAELVHIEPGDEPRLFYRLSWWKKVIVMAGGPTVNLLIAFFLFWGVFATYGNIADTRTSLVVSDVSRCIVPAKEDGRACTADDPIAPAYQAGIRDGDRLLSFNGQRLTSWDQLSRLIRANDNGDATVVYERDGQEHTVHTTTTVSARPSSPTDQRLVQVGFFGVSPTEHFATGGPLYTVGQMGEMTGTTVKALGTLPVKVWGVAKAIVGVEPRDINSPVSVVGGGRIAGETASDTAYTNQEKVVLLAMILASFNLFIGMFNFVPLLPLDGGHIAGALYEAVRRGLAKLRGRPDPGFVDVAKLLPVAYGVAGVLLLMGVVLIIGDIVAPVPMS
jgi:membrane-associated protease RseP (regulator of RpoE activity)